MALVFFGDSEYPVRCALELTRALRSNPEIRLRMGIHKALFIAWQTSMPPGMLPVAVLTWRNG